MALTPIINEVEKELHSLYSGISPLLRPFSGFYHRPWSFASIPGLSKLSKQKCSVDKESFQINLDVKNFAPNELSVKTVGNDVIIEGAHEERQDEHGFVSRQFTRRFNIPKGYDVKDVVSTLSSDGVLTVKAHRKAESLEEQNVRHIQIQQTGPAVLNITKETKEGEEKEAAK